MLTRTANAIWNEPSPQRPQGVPWWDITIPVVVVPLGIWEALATDGAPWRPVALALAILLPWTLVIRRARPLLAFLVGVTPGLIVDIIATATEVPWKAGASAGIVLLLAYSLFRWGAGRNAVKGLFILGLVYGITVLKGDIQTLPEAIAAVIVLLFAPTVGLAFRFRASAHQRQLEHLRLVEREQLARELHDTVAHHISAIAIQAQAGRAVAATRPEAAIDSLSVIEEAASRTLGELRTIVGVLRDGGDAERAPQRGIGDLEALAIAVGPSVEVHVVLRGNLDKLRPSVEAAVYRFAQESVTNVARHAVRASRVDVEVTGEADEIRIVVVDDGAPATRPTEDAGFGLVGMRERASLLGGSFAAGPGPDRGWRVEAMLPRKGPTP